MSHAFVKNHIHLAFSTKDRQPSISKGVQPGLWAYMAGNLPQSGNAPDCHPWHVRPRAYSVSFAANCCAGQGRSTSKDQLFPMDERTRTPLRLAGRIWRIQRERLEYGNRGEIYPQPGAASRQDAFEQEYRALLKKHGIDPDGL